MKRIPFWFTTIRVSVVLALGLFTGGILYFLILIFLMRQ